MLQPVTIQGNAQAKRIDLNINSGIHTESLPALHLIHCRQEIISLRLRRRIRRRIIGPLRQYRMVKSPVQSDSGRALGIARQQRVRCQPLTGTNERKADRQHPMDFRRGDLGPVFGALELVGVDAKHISVIATLHAVVLLDCC